VVPAARTMQERERGTNSSELPAGRFRYNNAAAMKGGTLP
jgi:hypothetical protein